VRAIDLLGRLGGDEFAVILTGDVTASEVATRLLASVARVTDGRVTASCGIAAYGRDQPGSAELLLAAADRAMYDAKRRRGSGTRLGAESHAH
jgi:diguanylate cyclase (GGDEF)-like protein